MQESYQKYCNHTRIFIDGKVYLDTVSYMDYSGKLVSICQCCQSIFENDTEMIDKTKMIGGPNKDYQMPILRQGHNYWDGMI